MSNTSFTTMGEKCGIASPPDTSVSSTSCVDSHLAPHPIGLTALTEDLAMLDLCVPSLSKQPCDTEEGEVTSSSEIVSAFWNNFHSPLDSVYNEPEKNPFGIITDEDIHCIQTALSTEEGMQILRQTMMTDLSTGYGLSEQDLLTDRLIDSLSESTTSAGLQTACAPLLYPNPMSSFELPESELRTTGEQLLTNGIPQMYPSLPSDELYSDVLEVLSGSQFDRRPLFDDDDDDEEIDRPIAIDPAHIDDLVLPDLPPVEDDGRRGEASDLEADDELVLDDNLLQSFSFIDPSYTSTADNCNSQLDFVFIDDVKLVDGFETDSSGVDAATERLRESATSKQLRRSTRIQENEQREMAERIRQENIQREHEEALRADERHLEEHERNKRRDSLSLSSAVNSGDSQMDLFTEHDEAFLFDASERSNSPRVAAQRVGKTIPEKRALCQKGKGKGRGKGGKAGKYNRPTSKAVGVWNITQAEVFDDTMNEEPLPKVEMAEEGGRDECSTAPSSDEKSDPHDENAAVQMSAEENNSKDQSLSVILHDEKLKAMTKVRLGRLELEAVLSKPTTHNALGAELEQHAEPTEECVYSKPQLARRHRRKGTESGSALEPVVDLTIDVSDEEKSKMDGHNFSFEGQSLMVQEESSVSISPPSEPSCVFPRGEKRRESCEDGETSVIKRKKLKDECEDHWTAERPKEEVELTGGMCEGPSPGYGSEETTTSAAAVSHQSCNKKNLKMTILQKTFSQEGKTNNKIKLTKHRSEKKLNNFRNSLDELKDSGQSQMESCVQEDRTQEKLSEEENKSRLQKKVCGKRKTDFMDKGIQDRTVAPVAPYKKLMREEKEVGVAEKERTSQEGKGDGKAVRKTSQCRGCQSAIQRLSLYCNKSCLLKYAELVVQQLKEKKQKHQSLLNSGGNRLPDKFVLFERSSGKRVKISLDQCETKLLNWILKHPTYEVLKPNNSQDYNRRTRNASDLKLNLKRPMATCAQDHGSKSSDKTVKTQDKVSPSSQDRLLPSGLLTRVASSHEVRKKVDHKRTVDSVSSARRKSSSSSKSEEKSDKVNASQKIPPAKNGHTADCSVKRLQHQELEVTISETTLHQKNSSSSLKSNHSVKSSSCTGSTDKIVVGKNESKSGTNKSSDSATIGRSNSRDHQSSNNNSNRGSDSKSSSSGSKGSRRYSIDDKGASTSARRNNSIDNKHVSSIDNKKDNVVSKGSKTNGSRKGSSTSSKSSHSGATARQSTVVPEQEQQPVEILDVARIDIRNELCNILTSRVNRANDVLMSAPEIKRLTLSIDDELWKSCSGVVSKYKRKYRLVLAYLTDPKNHGLFRQVLCGRVTPSRLLHMMSQTDKLSNRPISHKGSKNYVGSQSQSLAKTGSLLMAISDTTSMHGQHVFDVNCRVCTGMSSDLRAKESSALRAKESSDLSAKEFSDLHAKEFSELHAKEFSDLPAKVSLELRAKVASDLRAKESSDSCAKESSDLRAKNSSDLRTKENSSPLPRDSAIDSRETSAVNKTKPVIEVDLTLDDVSMKVESQEIDADSVELPSKTFSRDESLLNGDGVPPWLNTSPVIIPGNSPGPGSGLTDPRDRTRVIPRTKSLVRIKRYPALPSDTKPSTESTLKSDISHDIEGRPEDLPSSSSLSSGSPVWKGNIFAQDVALVAVDAFHLAGSMKFVKTLLPESLTVMGRLEPEVVYEYLTKLKTCYSATKEIAVVGFRASNDPNSSLYSLLYAYLHQRHRCGVIGSIGTAIKDMYIVPLPAKSPIPDILLPDIGPVLGRGRDLLLGVIVQQTSRAVRMSRAVASKEPHAEHGRSASHVPTEVKSESVPVAELSDEKSSGLNDASSETGNNRASESCDSDSLDVDGSDAIISGYSKMAPSTPVEQKTDLVPVVDVKHEKGPVVDDGDEPYDPFDEEEDEEESVTSLVTIKPTVRSSSSLLPASSAPLSSDNSSSLDEGLANLTAVLSTMTNFPVPATILATLVTQATPPNLEGLAKLAIILSGQMNALKQEHIPNCESDVVSGRETEVLIKPEIDDVDNATAKLGDEFGVDGSCDDGSKQDDTAENDLTVNGERRSRAMADFNVGRKSESVIVKNRDDVSTASGSCRDAGRTTGSSPPDGVSLRLSDQTQESEDTVDDGRAAKKTALSKLHAGKAEFSHLEEDDNEDHLVIDLDSPISEDAFDAKPVGRSDSWHSGLTAVELANGSAGNAEKADVHSQVSNIDGIDREQAEENSGLKLLVSESDGTLTENASVLRSVEDAMESLLSSPSDQEDCLEEQGGIFDVVEDEDVFSCKPFVAMQDAYEYENAMEIDRRDDVRQEQTGFSLLSASDGLSTSKERQEAFTDTRSAVEDQPNVSYAKAPWSDESSRSSGDAYLGDGGLSCLRDARLGLTDETGSETAYLKMLSAEIADVRGDEPMHTDLDIPPELPESPASEIPVFKTEKVLEEEKEDVMVDEVAPLPAPPRPPDRLLQSLKPCPLPEPLLRPPSPKTLLTNPFGFHGIFNPTNKPVTCVQSTEEAFRECSSIVHSGAMSDWDPYGSGSERDFPQTEPNGEGPFDSLPLQSGRLGGPRVRALLQGSVCQKLIEKNCQNVVRMYDTDSPSFLESSGPLVAPRSAYHDDPVSVGMWLDSRTHSRTPPPVPRPWKSTGASNAGRRVLRGSECSEEADEVVQPGVKVRELAMDSFGKKMVEPVSMGHNYLSTDEEQSGAAYGMRRHQPSGRGLARRGSAKEGRSPPPFESYNGERGIAHVRNDLGKNSERRRRNSRCESERLDQKTRMGGRFNADREASAATEYTRTWSNSLLCPPGFSEDLSASSSSRGSLLHFRDEAPKALHFPAARSRQSKDEFEKGRLRSSPRAKCAGRSSGESIGQPVRSVSRLLNAEMSWSEIVSRKEAMSGRDAIRPRRPSVAEESLRFQDLDDRFCSEVDHSASDRQQEGSAWMLAPGREDWRRSDTLAGENSDWSLCRNKVESVRRVRVPGYSRESEVKRWEMAEEEQEEGEYVDDQGGDCSEAFGLNPATDRPNYFLRIKDELSRRACIGSSTSLKPNINNNSGENDSPSCGIINNGMFGSKLRELRVEIEPSDARKTEDDELEDGEITDPSPPLTHSIIPPLLSSTDLWAKEFLESRRQGKASAERSDISSCRLERNIQPLVPHSNVTKKAKLPEEPPKQFRNQPPVVDRDDRSGVCPPSLLRPSYGRYIPNHQHRGSTGRLPDKEDGYHRLSGSSSGSDFWNGSSSGRVPRDRSSNFYPPA